MTWPFLAPVLFALAVTPAGAARPVLPAHAGLACAACHPRGQAKAAGITCTGGGCHARVRRALAESAHDRKHLGADRIPCPGCHGGHPVARGEGAARRACALALQRRCLACHEAERYVAGPGVKPPAVVASPEHNVHAAARRVRGCAVAGVSCFTCHGMHGTIPLDAPRSPVSRQHVASTCGACHRREQAAFAAGVHGRGVQRGDPLSPTCVSCHGAHRILRVARGPARTAAGNVVYTCAGCHEDPRVVKDAGLRRDVVLCYERTPHGMAYRHGISDVATCVTCHGAHDVQPAKAPGSRVSPARIRATCRGCHAAVTDAMLARVRHAGRGSDKNGSGLRVYFPVAGTALDPLLASGIGGIVGFLSGVFGVGGGFLMTPLLIFIGIPAAVAAATDSAQITAGASSGMISHARLGNVDFKMGLAMIAGSWPGGFLGVRLVHMLRGMGSFDFALKLLYVVLLGFTGFTMLVEGVRALRGASARGRTKPSAGGPSRLVGGLPLKMSFPKSGLEISVLVPVGAGLVVGLLAAFLGVGGGFILMPVMIYLIGIPTRVAVGTGLFQIMVTCAYVTVEQAARNHTVDLLLALALFAGSTIGAQFGVLASRRLRGEQIRVLLAIIVLGVMAALVYGLVSHPASLIGFARSGKG